MKQNENNIIIAKFMGFQKTIIGWYDYEEKLIGIEKDNTFDILKFNTDWNWLITVVNEIEQNYKYFGKELQLKITKYSVSWQTLTNEDGIVISPVVFNKYGTYAGTEKLEAIYESCIDFIKWFNKNNNYELH